MKLNVVVLVWGQDYVRNFCRYALPSLLSPNNLPALVDKVETKLKIYTREVDRPIFELEMNDGLTANLTKTVEYGFDELPAWDYSTAACAAQNYAQRHVLAEVRTRQEAVLFCSPDVMWSDGSLGYVGKALGDGKLVVFMPSYRVVTETIVHEVTSWGLMQGMLNPQLASQLLLKHVHPLLGAFHYKSSHCPPHIEYVVWPVANEGLMVYHLARAPDYYVPHAVKWTGQELVSDENDPATIDAIYHSDYALGLSLTPLSQCANWITSGEPTSHMMFGQFMFRHHASLHGLLKPVCVPAVVTPTPHLWNTEIHTANIYFEEVLRCRDDVLRGAVQSRPGVHMAQSYGTELSIKDIELYKNLLHWAPEDCATVKLLDRMAGDGW